METTRLHPLLTAAAISITVFSAVGVAALTGLVPASIGSAKTEPVLEVPKPVEPAITHPVPAAVPAADGAWALLPCRSPEGGGTGTTRLLSLDTPLVFIEGLL